VARVTAYCGAPIPPLPEEHGVSDTTDQVRRLEAFLRRRSDEPDSLRVVRCEAINGGYSRQMTRVWVEERDVRKGYVVRADPPPGQAIIDTDRSHEWAVLTTIHEMGTVVMPAPRWFDPSGEELGSPSIVLDLVESESLLARERRTAEDGPTPGVGAKVGTVAGTVHTTDATGLPAHVATSASWDEYVDSRIQRWIDAELANVSPNPLMRYVANWLRANKPPPVPLGLVHGDFQLANVLIDESDTFWLVDWELAHVGDPREDLGWWVLGLALQAPEVVIDLDEILAAYRDVTGFSEEQVNPATIAYFTVFASDNVFLGVVEQLAGVAWGETTGMTVAYMANAVVGMENEFITAMNLHDSARKGEG
jgi:aminoglycoside phosphotransferase (APT) family kinase protein